MMLPGTTAGAPPFVHAYTLNELRQERTLAIQSLRKQHGRLMRPAKRPALLQIAPFGPRLVVFYWYQLVDRSELRYETVAL